MKLINKIVCSLILLILISCGGDEDESTCTQANWIGIYTLITEAECEYAPMSSLIFNDQIVIEAGSAETLILWDGDEGPFNDCIATDQILTLELNGDLITSSIENCTADYRRQ